MFDRKRVGPLPLWVYAGILIADVAIIALVLTIFWALVDFAEDYLW